MFRPEHDPEERPSTEEMYINSLNAMRSYQNNKTLEEIFESIDEEIAMAQHPQLRLELEDTLREINASLEYVRHLAQHRDVAAETMQYPNGQYIMFGLLAAKAQVLNSLANMR